MLWQDAAALSAETLPPFAAIGVSDSWHQATVVTDAVGFRQMFMCQRDTWTGVSTSARVLAALGGRGLDREALAVQTLVGWQVGQATLFEGVTKLAPGARVTLSDGRGIVSLPSPIPLVPIALDDAVATVAETLRTLLRAYVSDHPDVILQLSGGQDSRIILSAIPPEMRRELRAMTFDSPGSADTPVAVTLSDRVGLRHQVGSLNLSSNFEPDEAYSLTRHASIQLDSMSDPLSMAGNFLIERQFDQDHRLGGDGGEVARGFYYFGPIRDDLQVTRGRVEKLAGWKMFANEAADPMALATPFRKSARDIAIDRIHAAMARTGRDWWSATDDFYLSQRVQRWTGLRTSAVCFARSTDNPMLDERFISAVRRLAPTDKANSLFFARLQMALDPDLGRIPLEGRPAPAVYADPTIANRTRIASTTANKAVKKIKQRVGRKNRISPGSSIIADRVLEYYRRNPQTLDAVRDLGVLDQGWLDGVLAQGQPATATTVALLMNLEVSADALDERP